MKKQKFIFDKGVAIVALNRIEAWGTNREDAIKNAKSVLAKALTLYGDVDTEVTNPSYDITIK